MSADQFEDAGFMRVDVDGVQEWRRIVVVPCAHAHCAHDPTLVHSHRVPELKDGEVLWELIGRPPQIVTVRR